MDTMQDSEAPPQGVSKVMYHRVRPKDRYWGLSDGTLRSVGLTS